MKSKTKIKKLDSVQKPETIKELLDATGLGYQDKFPTKLATKIQPVIIINQSDIMEDTIKKIYPIGSLYFSTLPLNPSSIFGFGTWAAFGEGRMIVSVPSGGTGEGTAGTALSDTENRSVGQHTHTFTGSVLPGHTHKPLVANFDGNTDLVAGATCARRVGPGANMGYTGSGSARNWITSNVSAGTPAGTNANSGSVAGTNAPYIQIFMWKRTA